MVRKLGSITSFALICALAIDMPWCKALDPVAVLAPVDGCTDNYFGKSVAISGDYIAVGAPLDPCLSAQLLGAVYVFRRLGPTWIQVAKLTAPDGVTQDQLGYAVAMDGDVIVASAPHYFPTNEGPNGPGAVYVFRRDHQGTPNDPWDDSWPIEAKLSSPGLKVGQLFGWSVAISGDLIVVGEPRVDTTAEVFKRNCDSWIHLATLRNSDFPPGWRFGTAVDLDGNQIVVGAPTHNNGPGAAYVFGLDADKWVESQILIPSDLDGVAHFGHDVAISGGVIAVGAPLTTQGISLEQGAAFSFVKIASGDWIEQSRLTAPTPSRYEEFGAGVSVDDDVIVAGRAGHPWAFIFQETAGNWIEREELFGIDGGFAYPISIDKKYAAVVYYIYAVRDTHSIRDYASFQNCVGTDSIMDCSSFHSDSDGPIDLRDFERFLGTFSGPGNQK